MTNYKQTMANALEFMNIMREYRILERDLTDTELKRREEIENFNKKALYILIREMTNIQTSYITKVVNIFRKQYKHLLQQFEKKGIIDDKRNIFF